MSQINLLPEYYVKQRFRNRVDMTCVLLFVLVMGGVIAVGTVQGRQVRQTQARYEAICRQFDYATDDLSEIAQWRGKKNQLLQSAKDVSELEETLPRSYLLSLVIRALPKDVNLEVLEISEKIHIDMAGKTNNASKRGGRGRQAKVTHSTDPKAEEESPKTQVTVKMLGYAASDSDVARLFTTLKAYTITDDVALRHTREHEGKDGRRREFQIDWRIKKEVDVLDHLTDKDGIPEGSPPDKDQMREEK